MTCDCAPVPKKIRFVKTGLLSHLKMVQSIGPLMKIKSVSYNIIKKECHWHCQGREWRSQFTPNEASPINVQPEKSLAPPKKQFSKKKVAPRNKKGFAKLKKFRQKKYRGYIWPANFICVEATFIKVAFIDCSLFIVYNYMD